MFHHFFSRQKGRGRKNLKPLEQEVLENTTGPGFFFHEVEKILGGERIFHTNPTRKASRKLGLSFSPSDPSPPPFCLSLQLSPVGGNLSHLHIYYIEQEQSGAGWVLKTASWSSSFCGISLADRRGGFLGTKGSGWVPKQRRVQMVWVQYRVLDLVGLGD